MDKKESRKLGLRNASDQQNIPSPDFRKLYVNNVLLAASNWDMNLTFGEIIGLNDNGVPVVEQKVKLNMSKEFMKALVNVLTVNIANYEKHFGEITFINIEDLPQQVISHRTPAKLKPKTSSASGRKRRS